MKLHHAIITLVNFFFSFINLKKKKQLRILTFHHIRDQNFTKLFNNIKTLKKKYKILTPNEFFQIVQGKKKLYRDSLLLTFDDGYFSQKKFSEKLNLLKIKVIFFIVPNFVKIKNYSKSKNFVITKINKFIKIKKFDYNMRNMSFADLKILVKKGHMIGMHTKNHKMLSIINNKLLLKNEILSDKVNIAKKLNLKKISTFAYPYGNINAINKISIKEIFLNYNYIFSGVRGNNLRQINTRIFFREAINDNDNINLILGFINGYADFYYSLARKRLLNMTN